jgi:tRNA uridine 5-carboxymethylaminomethyl modification enzyme
MLRSDNAPDRLTPIAEAVGLLGSTELGAMRRELFAMRCAAMGVVQKLIDTVRIDHVPLRDMVKRPEFGPERLEQELSRHGGAGRPDGMSDRAWRDAVFTVHTERVYASYIERQRAEVARQADLERRKIPAAFDYAAAGNIRTEARQALSRFRPETLGQAARLEGMTPADITLLAVLLKRRAELRGTPS